LLLREFGLFQGVGEGCSKAGTSDPVKQELDTQSGKIRHEVDSTEREPALLQAAIDTEFVYSVIKD